MKKSTPNFSKNEYFLPPNTHTYSFFGNFGVLPCDLRFEIHRLIILLLKAVTNGSNGVNVIPIIFYS